MVRIVSPRRGDPDVVRVAVAFAPRLMPRRTAIPGFPASRAYGLFPTTRAPESAADAVPPPLATQVNIPKAKKSFCKKCKKHSPHKVTQYKTGKASLYAQGAYRERERSDE